MAIRKRRRWPASSKDKFWPVDIAYFDETKKAARSCRNTASASSCTRTASPATSYGLWRLLITGKLVDLAVFETPPQPCQP